MWELERKRGQMVLGIQLFPKPEIGMSQKLMPSVVYMWHHFSSLAQVTEPFQVTQE